MACQMGRYSCNEQTWGEWLVFALNVVHIAYFSTHAPNIGAEVFPELRFGRVSHELFQKGLT